MTKYMRLCLGLVGLTLAATTALAEDTGGKSLTTRDGTTYTGVTVTGHTDAYLSILHDAGGAKIHFEDLPADVQKQYKYDPFKIWQTDYKAAKRLSRKHERPLLISFVGSDWDPDSQKLIAAVFESRDFKRYAKENLVLFEADSLKTKPMPKEQREQNMQLAEEMGVDKLPVVLIFTPDGEEAGELGLYPDSRDDKGGKNAFMTALRGVILSAQHKDEPKDEEKKTESASSTESANTPATASATKKM